MNSIIHCNTSYTAIQTRNNYYSTIETINIFLDHKKTGGLNTKKWVAKKLDGSINWLGQTLNWMGQCPAGQPIAPPLLQHQ